MNTVRVQLGDRSYSVVIGRDILASAHRLCSDALDTRPIRAFCVVDAGVPDAMAEVLEASFGSADIAVSSSVFEPNEQVKSIETWGEVLCELAATGQDRSEPVVALGGGIVCDIAGFVAASYRRGVPVIQCPSTLLAMVDASVGGKAGVNLVVGLDEGTRLLKNLVGAFHQPRLVIADTALLDSLDARQFRAGLAECIKHGMISAGLSGSDLLCWTEEHLDQILAQDHKTVIELITRSVSLKAEVVSGDEHETASSAAGGRALLNLGHTFGHAIETLPGLTPDPSDLGLAPLLHGEAVGLGLVAACASAEALGLIDAGLGPRIEALIARAGLPTRIGGLPENKALFSAMQHDKKTRSGMLRMVLPIGAGSARVIDNPDKEAVFAGLDAIRA